MSKKKKNPKIEKETRRLMEGIADLVKKKGDKYKFKSGKKKQIKKIKRTCIHWIIRKGKDFPTVVLDSNPMNWRCTICGATFPIRPGTDQEYDNAVKIIIAYVNQLQFWSAKMGGDAADTKLFLQLKQSLPRLMKVQKNILKEVRKRQQWEDRKSNTDSLSQFDSYAGYSYRSV